jgi:hypothetical protein
MDGFRDSWPEFQIVEGVKCGSLKALLDEFSSFRRKVLVKIRLTPFMMLRNHVDLPQFHDLIALCLPQEALDIHNERLPA